MKSLLYLFLIVSTYAANAQTGNTFKLRGKLDGIQRSDIHYIYLSYTDNNNAIVKDSATVVDGAFAFDGHINATAFSSLFLKNRPSRTNNDLMLFLEPKQVNIALTVNDFDNAAVTGSVTQNELTALNTEKAGITKRYQKQIDSLNAEKDHYKMGLIRERLQPYLDEIKQLEVGFISKHPKSFLSVYLLNVYVSMGLTIDTAQAYFDRLSDNAKSSSFGVSILKKLSNMRDGAVGKTAFLFASTDINGKELNLESYKGKYVLLDFWGSWCVPCRQGNPHLKKLYVEYKNKGIEFIGLASDVNTTGAWRKAVKEDGIDIWKHVLTEDNNKNDLSKKYGVNSYPTKILIDPKGVIVGRYNSDSSELDKQLASVLK